MHPASSIILFTSLSGLGFGLMMWLGIGLDTSQNPFPLFHAALAIILAGIGLLASMFHLGNLVEIDQTDKIFTNPEDKRTQDYITGRYG